ncbi:Asp-tRNA(Asn)/Glu-tRNA(Gln) amidotransferase subunit GatC [Candidatus Nomurabacteria bacterium]|nr:Asp-tRNA(Asn)/Glu-tRNA(Gln) amidotransferase subunit GatC [Candidatus Nomurabacteria bacterium]
MSIDIQKLADLARIRVSDDEAEALAGDLENIVRFVDIVQSRDVSGVPTVAGEVNVFRDDVVAPLATVYDLVEVAPESQDHFVKVPKIIE